MTRDQCVEEAENCLKTPGTDIDEMHASAALAMAWIELAKLADG